MSGGAGQAPFRAGHVARFALLSLIWGASYLLIKYAVADLSPAVVVACRTFLAAACLLAYMGLRHRGDLGVTIADVRARPVSALALGVTGVAAPFLLITAGELWVDSGVAAVLVASVPIFLGVLAPLFEPDERPGPRQWLGLTMGIVGVALVVGVETLHDAAEFGGAVMVLGAAALYALSGIVVKLRYPAASPLGISLVEVAVAAVLTAPVALLTLPGEAPGLRAVGAIVVLGVVGTAVAFVVFYRVFADVGATRSSLVAYLIPIVSVALGAIFLDERLRLGGVAGTVLILAGTALAARRRR